MKAYRMFKLMFAKKKGQSIVEYAFVVVFIALAALIALGILGGQLSSFFSSVADQF